MHIVSCGHALTRSIVQLRDALDHGQAEPRTAELALRREVGLIERVENLAENRRRHADARVANGQLDHTEEGESKQTCESR